MDKVERARKLYLLLEGSVKQGSNAEVARRNFCIQELLSESNQSF